MKLGMFDLIEPLPVLNNPHAIVVLRPWTDAGNSGNTGDELAGVASFRQTVG